MATEEKTPPKELDFPCVSITEGRRVTAMPVFSPQEVESLPDITANYYKSVVTLLDSVDGDTTALKALLCFTKLDHDSKEKDWPQSIRERFLHMCAAIVTENSSHEEQLEGPDIESVYEKLRGFFWFQPVKQEFPKLRVTFYSMADGGMPKLFSGEKMTPGSKLMVYVSTEEKTIQRLEASDPAGYTAVAALHIAADALEVTSPISNKTGLTGEMRILSKEYRQHLVLALASVIIRLKLVFQNVGFKKLSGDRPWDTVAVQTLGGESGILLSKMEQMVKDVYQPELANEVQKVYFDQEDTRTLDTYGNGDYKFLNEGLRVVVLKSVTVDEPFVMRDFLAFVGATHSYLNRTGPQNLGNTSNLLKLLRGPEEVPELDEPRVSKE